MCSGCIRKVSLNQIWCLVYTQPPSQITPRFILQPWRKIECTIQSRSGLGTRLLSAYEQRSRVIIHACNFALKSSQLFLVFILCVFSAASRTLEQFEWECYFKINVHLQSMLGVSDERRLCDHCIASSLSQTHCLVLS